MTKTPSRIKVTRDVGRHFAAGERGLLPTYEGFTMMETKDPRRYKRELRKWRASRQRIKP